MSDQLDDYPYNLGYFQRKITTSSSQAQVWFDRGLIWSYAFHYEEASTCYENALAKDDKCAMAYWGLAFALGPNYNKAWEDFGESELLESLKRTRDAVEKATSNASNSKPVERALIEALRSRYQHDTPPSDLTAWNQDYANAMETVYRDFGDDLDVAALFADALMNLTPWQLWDLDTGEPTPGSRALEAKEVLDRAMEQPGGYKHPGILHLYVHLIEMSQTPEKGLKAADSLRGLVPDAGHLEHMPSHLDVLIGDYRRAIASNADAIRGDDKWFLRGGASNFYSFYRMHDYASLIYAAMLAGQRTVALEYVDRIEATLPDEALRVESPPLANFLETFRAIRPHVLIRFGLWKDIIALKLPNDRQVYCVTIATTHYAKSVAYAALGDIISAESERNNFHEAVKRVPAARKDFPNSCQDVLGVAAAMLDGELEYRKGNYDSAFAHLRTAVARDDGLIYNEPWSWMLPTRHAYGALLLEQGHVKEAAEQYSSDLGLGGSLPPAHRHPNNVWALHGYHECLTKLGRTAEARLIEQQLQLVTAVADVTVTSSCFCRLSTSNANGGSCCT